MDTFDKLMVVVLLLGLALLVYTSSKIEEEWFKILDAKITILLEATDASDADHTL